MQEVVTEGGRGIKIGEGTLPTSGRGRGGLTVKGGEDQQVEERFWCNLDTKSCRREVGRNDGWGGGDGGGRRGSRGRGLGLFMLLAFYISICGHDHKNVPLSNVVGAEMTGGSPRDEEARRGMILRIKRYSDR